MDSQNIDIEEAVQIALKACTEWIPDAGNARVHEVRTFSEDDATLHGWDVVVKTGLTDEESRFIGKTFRVNVHGVLVSMTDGGIS